MIPCESWPTRFASTRRRAIRACSSSPQPAAAKRELMRGSSRSWEMITGRRLASSSSAGSWSGPWPWTSVTSGRQPSNHVAMDVGQPQVAAAVEVRQERMVEAQQMQDRGVQIVDLDLVLDGGLAEIVGRPVSLAVGPWPAHGGAEERSRL